MGAAIASAERGEFEAAIGRFDAVLGPDVRRAIGTPAKWSAWCCRLQFLARLASNGLVDLLSSGLAVAHGRSCGEARAQGSSCTPRPWCGTAWALTSHSRPSGAPARVGGRRGSRQGEGRYETVRPAIDLERLTGSREMQRIDLCRRVHLYMTRSYSQSHP